MHPPQFRPAGSKDAEAIACLHADSWRRHYRGAYSDAFLDGDIDSDRSNLWTSRLAVPGPSSTVVAEIDGRLAGFVHVLLDQDDRWGSLVDNLHVVAERHRSGIGRQLMGHAAAAVLEQARSAAMYLWVLEQNVRAQRFYNAIGGTPSGTDVVEPPGGVPGRLAGKPRKVRIAWPNAITLLSGAAEISRDKRDGA